MYLSKELFSNTALKIYRHGSMDLGIIFNKRGTRGSLCGTPWGHQP